MAEPIEVGEAMLALLRLAVAEREERADPELRARKTEVLLSEAGLSNGQIAKVTGKKVNAVGMTISRAKRNAN
jgi:DNA-directed RNA polymerase specialized sigma24 family protein